MVRVCVIGAGMSGVIAAKLAIKDGHEVTTYEKADQLGGTWVFDENINSHSSMYEVMQTNLPKEIMVFRDTPVDPEAASFSSHQDILRYTQKYAAGIPIEYSTTVDSVKNVDGMWRVDTTKNGIQDSQLFDVVFVCNGHFFDPKMTLDTSKFTGHVLHSHSYRRASDYRNQRIAVIGAGPSGIDIAKQTSQTAEMVYLIGRKAVYNGMPDTVQQYTPYVKELVGNSVILRDGTVIENLDTVVMCTGYRYTFPFFDSSLVTVKADGHLVSPLWEHVCHADHPRSLFFIGLNNIVVAPTVMEQQVMMSLAVVGGRANLPEEKEIRDWETERLRKMTSLGLPSFQYHWLDNDQWDYYDRMADIGNFPRWDFHKLMKKLNDFTYYSRDQNAWEYKNMNFILNENGDDFTVAK